MSASIVVDYSVLTSVMNYDQVSEWLKMQKYYDLDSFSDKFKKEEIDAQTIGLLTEQHLTEYMGMSLNQSLMFRKLVQVSLIK